MKLKKTAQIKNVGVFKDHSNNDLEYQDINFIYANNASGKTTLVDILKDLSDNNGDRIKERKTIPESGNQFIRIVAQDDILGSNEENITYEDLDWSNNFFEGRILVFDTAFIENNIFNGLNLLDRKDTKSNFSGFILGDSGVSLAKERNIINNKLTTERKLLKEAIPETMKDGSETEKTIKEYCEFKISEPLDDLEDTRDELLRKIESEKNLFANSEEINNFEEIPCVNVDAIRKFESTLITSESYLKETFEVDIDDWKTYTYHLEEHFPSERIGRKWIEEGIDFNGKTHECPFCGQNLSESIIYPKYELIFSDNFTDFSNSVRKGIEKSLSEIKDIDLEVSTREISFKIQESKRLFGESFIISDDFYMHLTKLQDWNSKNLDSLIEEKEKLKEALKLKNILVNENIKFTLCEAQELLSKLNEVCFNLNEDIRIINEDISRLKDKSVSQDKSILEEYETKLEKVNAKIKRLSEEKNCKQWLSYHANVEKLNKLRDEKDFELESSQEEYLDKYFEDINRCFSRFGGYNYKLERGATNKRYKNPVIGVDIYFRDTDVSDIESSKLFSESDRRSLALAIFVAKVKNMPLEELEKKILVFDDPVTSFDTDRMTPVCKSIIELSGLVKQTFILSHQYNFSKKMFSNFGGKTYFEYKKPLKYFQISKSGLGVSTISELDPIKVFNHEFIKQYEKVSSFIKGEHDNFTGNDLRIFIEDYLILSFPKIYCNEFSDRYCPFEDIITKLNIQEYITEEVSVEIRRYKDTLNPASHTFQHFSVEELRTYSREVIEYIDKNFRIH